MTQQALRELVALAEKATPGPWENCRGFVRTVAGNPAAQSPVLKTEGMEVTTSCLWVAECRDGEAFYNPDGNAAFIAAARNAIPHLKALLGEQREAQGAGSWTEACKNAGYWDITKAKSYNAYVPGPYADAFKAGFDAAALSAPPLAESVGDDISYSRSYALQLCELVTASENLLNTCEVDFFARRDGTADAVISKEYWNKWVTAVRALKAPQSRHMQQGK